METLIESKISTIKQLFGEERKIIPTSIDETLNCEGDVFKTDGGEIIYLETIFNDFTIDELVRLTAISEKLYDKYNTHCTCYILCMGGVSVNEMPITSKADFTIKLAQTQMHTYDIILNGIKKKISNHELLDADDIKVLQMIPMLCKHEERDYYRKQVFTIMNNLGL